MSCLNRQTISVLAKILKPTKKATKRIAENKQKLTNTIWKPQIESVEQSRKGKSLSGFRFYLKNWLPNCVRVKYDSKLVTNLFYFK